ncbi:protein DpdH [Thalassotalea ponticola]|uniref:protein DpdH n=1 Tax=Thalassotalea ponticola TaxID=1523392 RepID=UPI0025B60B45|nr:protein DpdH [Thalassotalea ponticola]MDN3652326.1 protein DpdH [Thalassotalea ponticola]
MSIQTYWPSLNNVENCILSEAERLSDKLLIAVHHPAKLISTEYGTQIPEVKSQQDLLNQLLKSNDIIPLLGESGSGKSHLIRWLHAVAKYHPQAIEENWHIIRIPKNASLSQVLKIILDERLQGDLFDQARKRISQVSNDLNEESTRNLLFTHINEALKNIRDDLKKEGTALKSEGKLTTEKNKEIRDKITFATQLDNFFADPHIKSKFSGKKSVINNRVSRLIEIKSYAELLEEHFELSEHDFLFTSGDDISVHLGSQAKVAYSNLQLESDEHKRKMAAKVTNQAIDRACKLMFNRLFRFNTGNFQDLFKEIRKYLLRENKTLVVLVEDLAAISAIDNVLIESLLEQDQNDGEQVLCRMKSVIAATDGLESYQSHRSTIWTRGIYEWRLPDDNDVNRFPELVFSNEDVLSFCARYINAARHGIYDVEKYADVLQIEQGVPIWKRELSDSEQKILDEFGYSPNGIPLFPYNKQAILKLVNKYVFSAGRMRFNPRVAIQKVLLAILRDHSESYSKKEYPSVWLESTISDFRHDETAQFILQNIPNQEMAKRLVGFMSLYSDANSKEENFKQISAGQANVFNLDSSIFSDDVTVEPKGNVTTPPPQQGNIPPISINRPETGGLQWEPIEDILKKKVDDWFSGKALLNQGLSNQLRQGLYFILEQHKGINDYSVDKSKKWGLKNDKSLLEFVLKDGSIIKIDIPGSATNISNKKVISVFEEKELSDSLDSIDLKRQMLAILRFTENNPTQQSKREQAKGWNYSNGFEDYIYYQEFVQKWLPNAIQTCLKIAKESAIEPLKQQLGLAQCLSIDLSSRPQRLSRLIQTSEYIKEQLPPPINDHHKEVLSKWLEKWDVYRSQWLRAVVVGTNNAIQPIDFDNAYKKIKDINDGIHNELDLLPVVKGLEAERLLLSEHLDGSETKQELMELLESLDKIYKNIPAGMRPNYSIQLDTVRKKVKDLIKQVSSETPKAVLADLNTHSPSKILNKINGDELKLWKAVLTDWKAIYPQVVKSIQKYNYENGSNKIEQYNDVINAHLSTLDASFEKLGGPSES